MFAAMSLYEIFSCDVVVAVLGCNTQTGEKNTTGVLPERDSWSSSFHRAPRVPHVCSHLLLDVTVVMAWLVGSDGTLQRPQPIVGYL